MGGNSTNNFKSIVLVDTFEHEAQEKNSFQVNKYCSCQVLSGLILSPSSSRSILSLHLPANISSNF
jgi:hypothetical protein